MTDSEKKRVSVIKVHYPDLQIQKAVNAYFNRE